MKVLLVGESWLGSDARGMKRAVAAVPGVISAEASTNPWLRNAQAPLLRLLSRFVAPIRTARIKHNILRACRTFHPDVILVIKGGPLDATFIRRLGQRFAPVVNFFPDASPHGQGPRVRAALNEYDLVISAKARHPALWREHFGYSNRCVHVPHGYAPDLHLRPRPPGDDEIRYDVVMVAGGRPEYAELIQGVIQRLAPKGVTFGVGGGGWKGRGLQSLPGVELLGPLPGRAYVDGLRKGRIVIAPVQTVLHIDGRAEPGDEVTARTFQCAAANVFFLHRRTPEAQALYDEATEVPMFDDAAELADRIEYFLAHPEPRRSMAAAAHRRAVPAYSIERRAQEIVAQLEELVRGRAQPASRSAA